LGGILQKIKSILGITIVERLDYDESIHKYCSECGGTGTDFKAGECLDCNGKGIVKR
jgi:DnaJ-class molecular chaperone